MTDKMYGKTPVSAISQRINDLVEVHAGGSQRKFAKIVGCSQPAISRVVNGKQKPGKDLLKKLAAMEGVDADELESLLIGEKLPASTHPFQTPVFHSLLDGAPQARKDQMVPGSLQVSATLHRPSLYAVPAIHCKPAFDDPEERMRRDDYVVIDSATDRFRANLQMLDGKLCVVGVGDRNAGSAVTLRRVWVDKSTFKLKIRAGEEPDKRQDVGADHRIVDLSLPEDLTPNEGTSKEVKLPSVYGVAVQLVRNL